MRSAPRPERLGLLVTAGQLIKLAKQADCLDEIIDLTKTAQKTRAHRSQERQRKVNAAEGFLRSRLSSGQRVRLLDLLMEGYSHQILVEAGLRLPIRVSHDDGVRSYRVDREYWRWSKAQWLSGWASHNARQWKWDWYHRWENRPDGYSDRMPEWALEPPTFSDPGISALDYSREYPLKKSKRFR